MSEDIEREMRKIKWDWEYGTHMYVVKCDICKKIIREFGFMKKTRNGDVSQKVFHHVENERCPECSRGDTQTVLEREEV